MYYNIEENKKINKIKENSRNEYERAPKFVSS